MDPSILGTGSCPKKIGKFGGALNLLTQFIFTRLTGGV